jgi:hypothetical protein
MTGKRMRTEVWRPKRWSEKLLRQYCTLSIRSQQAQLCEPSSASAQVITDRHEPPCDVEVRRRTSSSLACWQPQSLHAAFFPKLLNRNYLPRERFAGPLRSQKQRRMRNESAEKAGRPRHGKCGRVHTRMFPHSISANRLEATCALCD